jgi:protein-disulfide isomerase
MSPEKKMSKGQMMRAKRQRQAHLQRLGVIGIIVLGALLVAFALIYPSLKSMGEIVTVEPNSRPLVDGTAMGDPNAPVVIDIFEDFQCPACRTYSAEIETLITDTYVATGQVYYVFHQYPFLDSASVNKESQQAANASMCAAEQGLFWEYHDILFANWNGENAGTFSDRRLVAFAETLGLDMDLFTTCFEDNRYHDEIQADFDLGTEKGVSGTPSVFVNGQQITPGFVPGFDDIRQAVETALIQAGQ